MGECEPFCSPNLFAFYPSASAASVRPSFRPSGQFAAFSHFIADSGSVFSPPTGGGGGVHTYASEVCARARDLHHAQLPRSLSAPKRESHVSSFLSARNADLGMEVWYLCVSHTYQNFNLQTGIYISSLFSPAPPSLSFSSD